MTNNTTTDKEYNNKHNNKHNNNDTIYYEQYKYINGYTTYTYAYVHPLVDAMRRNEWEYNEIELKNI